MTAEDLEAADLTLAMARENLRHAVVTAPAVWPACVHAQGAGPPWWGGRAAGSGGGRRPWSRPRARRTGRAALLGDSAADDVADPAGGPQRGYAETAAILSGLLDQLVGLCWQSQGMRLTELRVT